MSMAAMAAMAGILNQSKWSSSGCTRPPKALVYSGTDLRIKFIMVFANKTKDKTHGRVELTNQNRDP